MDLDQSMTTHQTLNCSRRKSFDIQIHCAKSHNSRTNSLNWLSTKLWIFTSFDHSASVHCYSSFISCLNCFYPSYAHPHHTTMFSIHTSPLCPLSTTQRYVSIHTTTLCFLSTPHYFVPIHNITLCLHTHHNTSRTPIHTTTL